MYHLYIMEISNTPARYIPKMDLNTKEYTDHNIFDFTNGLICPCNNSSKVFLKKELFYAHRKTKKHKKWLEFLGENTQNFYQETIEQQQTIRTQQMLLTELEIKLKQTETIVNYLENKVKTLDGQLAALQSSLQTDNLLDFE